MPKLILKTGKPMDGEYPLDLTISEFSMREWGFMANVCNLLGSPAAGHEIIGRFFQNDGPAVVAVTGVMLQRAGKVPDVDALADAKGEAFTFDYSDLKPEAVDDGPPSQSPSENEPLGENADETESSG